MRLLKWDDYERYVKYYIKQKKEKANVESDVSKGKKTIKKNANDRNLKDNNNSKERNFEDIKEPIYTLDKRGNVRTKNNYDRGLFRNFAEVLFPPSSRTKK